MKQLQPGQHFGVAKTTLKLDGTILTEAGYVPNINVPWHYHENAYFYYHLRGRLDEINRKQSLTCVPGTLLFHHWQDPHYDRNFSKDALFFHIELAKPWFERHDVKPSFLEGSMQLDNPYFKTIFQKIHYESKLKDNLTQLSVDGLLLQSLATMCRDRGSKTGGVPGWVAIVKSMLHEENERLTLHYISQEAGIHPTHLSKEFPRYFDMSFGEYIRTCRVEKATRLLANDELSLTTIAYNCGFSDQSHFTRCFKAIHGIRPLQYRRAQRKH